MNRDEPQDSEDQRSHEPVSLSPLKLRDALAGILAIPDPEATKPKHEKAKRKKAPPTKKG